VRSLGAFDPRKATFYQKKNSLVNKEPVTQEVELCRRSIRFSMSRNGSEQVVQGQTRAYVPVTIRVLKDSKTVLIKTSDRLSHNGRNYEIVSVTPIPNEDDEIELACKAS